MMIIKEYIESPLSSGNAFLQRKKTIRTFRREQFEITEHFYCCEETGEEFTTDEIDQVNLNQVYNQYRDKYGLPFPDQIKKVREKYKVSASKMSEILGLGVNSYRLYEQGEVPSVGNGRLILAADDPAEFKRFLRSSREVIGEREYTKLISRVDKLIETNEKNRFGEFLLQRIFDVIVPNQFTGYRLPDFDKISHMVLFFSERTKTWKTKLNKLLFYSDFLAFKHSGYGISGLDYRAIQMGPVPSKFEDMYNEMSYGGIVERTYFEMDNGVYASLFEPILSFDRRLFSDFEIVIMEKISSLLKKARTKEIIEMSHKELAWLDNFKEKKVISYKDYGFNLSQL